MIDRALKFFDLCKIADADAEIFGRTRGAQLHAGQPHPAIEKMHVRIVESRRDAFALQINHLRIRADPFANLFGRTNRGDAISQNRNGFDFALFTNVNGLFTFVNWRSRCQPTRFARELSHDTSSLAGFETRLRALTNRAPA
ncbi:MAG: hypothetical protein MOB07_22800 [Acidobacteria bacterium]|nr:hypothetical protein [Acidobacteriota bacterium]